MQTIDSMITRLASREVCAVDLVRTALDAADASQDLNAFISLERKGALAAAAAADQRWAAGDARLLEGIPIAVKDNIAVAGQPLTGGSRTLGDRIADTDAATVKLLRDAGAIIIGKTNLHEFAFGVTSNNGTFGAVHNPSAPGYSPGGSSGGAAAAVAASIVPMGLATDTGGSGRIPAAFCGCAGFRPTTGRYSVTGVMQLTWTLDSVAVIASSVADVALTDNILSGSVATREPTLKTDQLVLGIPHSSFAAGLEPRVKQAFDRALATLESAGVSFIMVELNDVLRWNEASCFPIAMYEGAQLWKAELARLNMPIDKFLEGIGSPDVRENFRTALSGVVSSDDYAVAMNQGLTPLRSAYANIFASTGIDALIFPTIPTPPPPIGENDTVIIEGNAFPLFPTIVRNASPGALGALPGLSIPFGNLEGTIPFGVEIDGASGNDKHILAIGAALEALAPDRNSIQ